MGDDIGQNVFAAPSEEADFGAGAAPDSRVLATLSKRFVGALLDSVVYIVAILPAALVGGFLTSSRNETEMGAAAVSLMALAYVVVGGYQAYLITKTGQSLGKKWIGTRIIRENGDPPGFVHGVLIRNWAFVLAGFIPVVGSLIGLADTVAIFFGQERRTLHDRVAQTLVIEA